MAPAVMSVKVPVIFSLSTYAVLPSAISVTLAVASVVSIPTSEDNTPVTLINQIIYGIPAVAEKRFKRDVASTMYNTNLEHINVTKLKLRLLEAQLNREYGSSGKGDL